MILEFSWKHWLCLNCYQGQIQGRGPRGLGLGALAPAPQLWQQFILQCFICLFRTNPRTALKTPNFEFRPPPTKKSWIRPWVWGGGGGNSVTIGPTWMVHPSKFAEFHEEMFEITSKIVAIEYISHIWALLMYPKLHLWAIIAWHTVFSLNRNCAFHCL